MDPVEATKLLAILVATLIPGDLGWPAADVVGVQALLAARLVESKGEDALDQLLVSLQEHPDLLHPAEARRVTAMTAFAARDPDGFEWVRNATFMAYYECPMVVRAMNARGISYRLRPHIEGYGLPAFDPARDTPTHRRGHFMP